MSFRTFFNDENKSSSSGSASVSAAATVTNELASNLIIGFGPGGIAAALVACMKDTMKRKVIVLTDRASFTRTPIFRLDVDILPFLEELVGAATIQEYFQKNLIGPKQKMGDWEFHVIQIKTLEKMLFDSLRQQDRFEIIIVPKSTTYNIDSKNHLFEFSMDVNSVTQKRSIPFKYLIAADGCTHPTANAIENSGLLYDETQLPQIHTRHARATYRLPQELCSDTLRAQLKVGSTQILDNSKLPALGWKLASDPEVRVFTIDDYFFIAAECPEDLSGLDSKSIDRWLRALLSRLCPETIVDMLTKIESSAFEVVLAEANRTIVPFPSAPLPAVIDKENENSVHANTAYFLQIGDALRQTHYQTGSGAVTCLRQTKVLGEFLASVQSLTDLQRYHANVAAIRTDNRLRVDKFIELRNERELALARKNGQASTLAVALMLDSVNALNTSSTSLEVKVSDKSAASSATSSQSNAANYSSTDLWASAESSTDIKIGISKEDIVALSSQLASPSA